MSSVSKGRVELSVTGPRPLAAAALVLEERFQRAITYEEPPYIDPAGLGPGPGSMSIPRSGSIRIEYAEGETAGAVLGRVVQAHERAGNAGKFSVVVVGARVDLVPRAYRSAAGGLVEWTPLLDTVVTLPRGRMNGLQFIERLTTALHADRGHVVQIGTVPVNLLAQDSAADSEGPTEARRLLGVRLGRLARHLSWQLLAGPGSEDFVLNIHQVRGRPALSNSSNEHV
ncbi:hypothetical protein GCM10027451_15970 [Geodermatophilus aquaeductus]|uniref:hypothetical protein n=1 Tax=Geodermatophilus aquaeductus TaxID=1564161 RepID=UPI001158B029|nr:hypothetical protein [Geodermatophilus aquaeductus]